jgi:nicotinamide mononucleotide transporter
LYEFFGVLFSIIYVVLSIKQSIYCWFALIIAAIINGYAFFLIGLPLQSVMQIFFIVVGISGLKNWSNINTKKIFVISRNFNFHLYVILFGSILTVVLFKFLQSNLISSSQFLSKEPFFDSLMFMYNIIPMYMTTKKILESWLYFIWIDVISGFFYLQSGDYFYCFLFFFYIPFAIHGYLTWKKELKMS